MKKIFYFFIALFITLFFVNDVKADSAVCYYPNIKITVDDVSYEPKIELNVSSSQLAGAITIGGLSANYKDFRKDINGVEMFYCPSKIYVNSVSQPRGILYNYSFAVAEDDSRIWLTYDLSSSEIDNSIASGSSSENSSGSESGINLVRVCTYSAYTVNFYSNDTAKIFKSDGTSHTISNDGIDYANSCPNILYISGYDSYWGGSFTSVPQSIAITLTADNQSTADDIDKDYTEYEKTELPVNYVNVCTDNNTLKVFQVIGKIIFIIKILVPIILIVMGSIDFAKASLSGDDKAISQAAVTLGKRILIGLIIFFIPTVLDFFLSLVGGVSDTMGKYKTCTSCVLSPYNEDKCNPQAINSEN